MHNVYMYSHMNLEHMWNYVHALVQLHVHAFVAVKLSTLYYTVHVHVYCTHVHVDVHVH